jgi:rhodanese-related sulfurtransferase
VTHPGDARNTRCGTAAATTTPSPSNPKDVMTISTSTTKPARLDAASLREWTASTDGPRLLDVRTAAEFTTAHIPGSYNVPLDLLREHRDELRQHLDQDVVLICRSGARAGQAETLLAGTGLANLHVLDGGITAWQNTGAPVNHGPARWDLERQVRLVAGSLVLTGILASVVAPRAKWLSAAIGAGLTTAALTNTCAMGKMLSRLPYNRDAGTDLPTVIAALTGDRSS